LLVAVPSYLGFSYIHDGVKNRLNSGNAYYCSVQSVHSHITFKKKSEGVGEHMMRRICGPKVKGVTRGWRK
jgi:hypothetical protein